MWALVAISFYILHFVVDGHGVDTYTQENSRHESAIVENRLPKAGAFSNVYVYEPWLFLLHDIAVSFRQFDAEQQLNFQNTSGSGQLTDVQVRQGFMQEQSTSVTRRGCHAALCAFSF